MTRIPIKINTPNALRWLGSLYRDAADALKEHVSNAIDEHEKSKRNRKALAQCVVAFALERNRVSVEYPYGMSKDEFTDAMDRVADSAKKELDIKQIGQLGIGIFGFLQFGRKCTILSKKDVGCETFRAVLRDGSDDAELETATKKESLAGPGIRIVITELKGADPTKERGPLSVAKLDRLFSEKFASYLKAGWLRIVLRCGKDERTVQPMRLELPQIGRGYSSGYVRGDHHRPFSLELYFDPSAKGRVSIRHTGVVVVESVADTAAYGLEDSVYASGDIRGYIDADFLQPLPARTGFEENGDWVDLLDELDRLRPSVQAEVDELKRQEAQKRLTEIQREAMELAREVLETDELRDLELLGGRMRKTPEPRVPPNGFDFIPSSLRLSPCTKGTISLKALVPKAIADGARAGLSLSEPLRARLLTESVCFRSSAAGEGGVVSCTVGVEGLTTTMTPAVLTATCGSHTAKAHIRVAEPGTTRASESVKGGESGPRFNYVEHPFGAWGRPVALHSFFKDGTLEVNSEHPHYCQSKHTGEKLAYAALMVGKETIAQSYPAATDQLEKMLSFYFELRNRVTGKTPSGVKRPRGRPRKVV